METPKPLGVTAAPPSRRILVLPPLLDAIDAWQASPTDESRHALGVMLAKVAREMGLSVGRLRINAPPLADLDLDLDDGTTGAEFALRVPGDAKPIGLARPAPRTVVAGGVVLAESAIFVSNNQVCPLTPLAEQVGAKSGSVATSSCPTGSAGDTGNRRDRAGRGSRTQWAGLATTADEHSA